MKAITVWQPWASLLVRGPKTAETRFWSPSDAYHGKLIAIHAAKQPGTYQYVNGNEAIQRSMTKLYGENWDADMPRGAVVGVARLIYCSRVVSYVGPHPRKCELANGIRIEPDPFGDYAIGRHIWQFDEFEHLNEPIPAKGRQGLWNWDEPDNLHELLTMANKREVYWEHEY